MRGNAWKRLLAGALTAAMLAGLLPAAALAAPDVEDLRPHHPKHTEACGYLAPGEGTPCGHIHEAGCYSDGILPTEGEEAAADACAHTHDETCGYTPATAGTPCGFDCSICPVQALIDALPTADELAAMSSEEQQAVYEDLQTAYEAYNALTDEQKAEVTGAEIFDSLFDVFNGMVNTLADGSVTRDGITITYSNGGYASYSDSGGLQITSSGDYTISGTWSGSITGAGRDNKKHAITVSGNITANITMQGLTIDASGTQYVGAFGIKDGATVNLTLSGANSLNSGRSMAGLYVYYGTTLTIGGSGSLKAICTDGYGAGIGAGDGNYDASGNITINGGTIEAIGGRYAPGIGTLFNDDYFGDVSPSIITINGGAVTAIGGEAGAGIGGGYTCLDRYKVTISGGTVTAIGGLWARGIGAGNQGQNGTFSTGQNGDAVISAQGYQGGQDGRAGIGDTSNQSNWSGSILSIGDGSSGIYGGDSFTLREDLEIIGGNTLNIQEGKTLYVNSNVTLTNNGSITGYGTLDGDGDLDGSGTVADTIKNNLSKESEVKVDIDPSEAVYGSTVTITAKISKKENALTRAEQNKVNFYLGTVDNGTLLDSVDVSNNTATLQVSLNDEKWTVGQHTITAEYGGSMTLKSESGTATLTVMAIQLSAPGNPHWDNTTTPGRAVWDAVENADSYSVQLYRDGATEGTPVSVEEGTAHNFNITEAGTYFFKVQAIGTGNYSDSVDAGSGNLTFYSVSFETNGGSNITSQVVVQDGKAAEPEAPTKTGYDFKGWYSDSELTKLYDFANSAITDNTFLYAKWEPSVYKVTLIPNGGTINSGNIENYTYGEGATLPTADDMTYTGHTFMGWYENSDFSGDPVTEISATDTGAKTYYAEWLSADAGVTEVSINNKAGTINGDQITVVLDYGTAALPTDSSAVSITQAAGATVSNLLLSKDDGSEWTFTVTAEDGETEENYTITVSIAPDPAIGNRGDVNAAKSTVENHDWTVPQATAVTEEAVKTWIEGQLAAMNLNGASYEITMNGFTAATAGTAADRDGANGDFSFTVKLFKGENTGNIATSTYAEAAATISNGTITAAPYTKWTVAVTAEGSGTVSGGGTFENGSTVTVTAVPNGSRDYFIRWTENGAEVSRDAAYSFSLTADRNLIAEFGTHSSSDPTFPPTVKPGEGGEVTVKPRNPEKGDKVTITPQPEKDYEVGEVIVTDKDGDQVKVTDNGDGTWSFIQPNGKVTIEVTFREIGPEPLPFTDVPSDAWYIDGVQYVYTHHIMSGTSPTTFSPSTPVSRSVIVQVLYNLAGQPEVEGGHDFSDVPAGYWSEEAIIWAVQNGAVGGYGDGTFGPDDTLTREQLAVVLFNYANAMGYDTTARRDLSGFDDVTQAQDWARTPLEWAYAEHLITGTSDTTMSPTGQSSRAQIAVIMMRFCEQYAES